MKKTLVLRCAALVLTAAALTFLLVSCEWYFAKYYLVVTVKEGSGTTNPAPGKHGPFDFDTTVEVTAIPDSGWHLKKIVVDREGDVEEFTDTKIGIKMMRGALEVKVEVYFEADSGGSNITGTPVFSPGPGTYYEQFEVTITCPTPGATIYYETNGSRPSILSPVYQGPIQVTRSSQIVAVAQKAGLEMSQITSGMYGLVAAKPTFSAPGDEYQLAQRVEINSATPGAIIYYTLDGSDPWVNGTEYSGYLLMNRSGTLRAVATTGGSGNFHSEETSDDYSITEQERLIFHDKGSYGEDGWRWMEAAPAASEWTLKPWGGRMEAEDLVNTGAAVGDGLLNTDRIVLQYGAEEPHVARSDYAARLCSLLTVEEQSDWFLPSIDELSLMVKNLYRRGLGSFGGNGYHEYSSSTEDNDDPGYIYHINFTTGNPLRTNKLSSLTIRAARRF